MQSDYVDMPRGIRAIMWLSLVVAVAGSIVFVVFALVTLWRGDVKVEWFIRWAVSAVVTVAVSWWIALAIRAERAYVRPLLVTVVAAELVLAIAKSVFDPGFLAERSDETMVLFALLLFYLLRRNGTVAHYYAHLRARAQS